MIDVSGRGAVRTAAAGPRATITSEPAAAGPPDVRPDPRKIDVQGPSAAPGPALGSEPMISPTLPRRGRTGDPLIDAVGVDPAAVPVPVPHRAGRHHAHPEPQPEPQPATRPPIDADPAILGLSRRSRSRTGSQVFTWFFVLVFALIAGQMVVALLLP